TRRATMALVAMLRPIAIAKTKVNKDSVSPTVATASAPSRPTQNTSTMPNTDSMAISNTIGTARSVIARPRITPGVAPTNGWCRKPGPVHEQHASPGLIRGYPWEPAETLNTAGNPDDY